MNIRPQTIEKYVRFLNLIKQNEGNMVNMSEIKAKLGIGAITPKIAQQLGLFVLNGKRVTKVNYKNVEPIMARRLIEKSNDYTYKKNANEPIEPITSHSPSPLKRVRVHKENAPAPIQKRVETKIVELRILGIPLFKYTKS
jgi:hypothetical protein